MKIPLSFEENLIRLPTAFKSGFESNSTDFFTTISNYKGSLVIIGSGASYSTSILLSKLLEYYFKIPVRCKTPYEYAESSINEGTILISASGKNHDILNALNHALAIQVQPLIVITSNKENLIIQKAKDYPYLVSLIVEFENTKEREGFLGSQSLIAFAAAFLNLVPEISNQIKNPYSWCKSRCNFAQKKLVTNSKLISFASKIEHLVAVHTFWGSASVMDFESKFVEGGLGYIETSEAKNYTHGRFVNSISRKNNSIIFFFGTPNDKKLISLYKTNIGSLIPVLPITSPYSGILGAIDLMITMFFIFNKIAKLKNIEISHPSVPDEAKEMFHAKKLYPFLNLEPILIKATETIVGLKRNILVAKKFSQKKIDMMVPASVVRASIVDVYSQDFNGLMCDYDGTLVPIDMKDQKPSSEIVAGLTKLLKGGIPVAIVTGRGKSVIKNLRTIIPKKLYKDVFCYLYNGGVFWKLDKESPEIVEEISEIDVIIKFIQGIGQIQKYISNIEKASLNCQITINPKSPEITETIFPTIKEEVTKRFPNLTVASSGRSIDIFPATASKVKASQHFANIFGKNDVATILKIGDRGDENGNDFGFLQLPSSFSVDKFHWLPNCGFPFVNKSGEKLTGINATAYLLNSITLKGSQFSLLP